MKVLILEDDTFLSELLEAVVGGLYTAAEIARVETLRDGVERWQREGADLVILDWNLPDGSGLELVKMIRKQQRDTPLVMISGRSDRDSVLTAAHHGINGYISKPFNVEMVRQRLAELLDPDQVTADAEIDLEELLKASVESVIQLPSAIDTASVLEMMEQKQDLSPSKLADLWACEAALNARMLDVANSSSFQKTGEPVRGLRDAIATLGVDMALRYALAMSLDISGHLRDSRLSAKARTYIDLAGKVAEEARRLAASLGEDFSEFSNAAILSRVGELAVLKIMQQFQERGGQLADDDIERGLSNWAQTYGNRLKVQWRLPLQMRDLIGAVHFLPRDVTQESRLVMRTAALRAQGQKDSEECERLMRRIGLEDRSHQSDEAP